MNRDASDAATFLRALYKMNKIPFAELALGAARNQAFAEGLAAGASTGRLWARKQDDKRDAILRMEGQAIHLAVTKYPGYQLWAPDSPAKAPIQVNLKEAYDLAIKHTRDPSDVAHLFGVPEGGGAMAGLVAASKRGNWFEHRLEVLAGKKGEPYTEMRDAVKTATYDAGAGNIIEADAIEFMTPASGDRPRRRLWLTRRPRVIPKAVEELGSPQQQTARLFEAVGVPPADAADAAETLEAIGSPVASPVARRPSRSTKPPERFTDSKHSRG